MSTKENEIKNGVCKNCGQTIILSEDLCAEYPNVTEADELASLTCECEAGKKWREAKKQEVINIAFTNYAEHDLVDFMRSQDYKRVLVQDKYGNTASLFKMEKGDIKITTSLKRII